MKEGDWVVYKNPGYASKFDGMLGIVREPKTVGGMDGDEWIVDWCLWPPHVEYIYKSSGELVTYLLPVGR